jgi:transcriptional regulator with XRE-family HTH domain
MNKLTFGQTIRAAREKKGITQQELLKLIRGKYFSPAYMSKIEVDGAIPSVYRIIDLADVLDLDQRDLWELAKSEKIEAYSLKLSKRYERERTRHWELKLKK